MMDHPRFESLLSDYADGILPLGQLRAFGEHIHSRFVDIKRAEWEDYRVQITPYEIERYLPVL